MKKAGIKKGLADIQGEFPPERTSQKVAGRHKERRPKGSIPKGLVLPKEAYPLMLKDKARGMTLDAIGAKYGLSTNYVQNALATLFITNKVGREVLKGVHLENAIATGMKVRETIEDLSPMQAAIVSGISTQRYIDLERHTQSSPPDVDFTELKQVGQLLRGIRDDIGISTEGEDGEIIDIQTECSSNNV